MLDKLNIKNRKKHLKCVVMIKTGHRTNSKMIIITVSIKQNTNISKQICLLFTIVFGKHLEVNSEFHRAYMVDGHILSKT